MSEAEIVASVRYVQVEEDGVGQRLDNFLMKTCKGVPKSRIYRIIRNGEVRVNKGRADVEYRLQLGDLIRVPPLRVSEPKAVHVPGKSFPVLFEDDALLVINKPAGVAVHGGSGVNFGVIEQLRAARPEARFLELVHRLDRETSGLLVIAKKRSALVVLHEQLRIHAWTKRYFALVVGKWTEQKRNVKLNLTKWVNEQGERRVSVSEEGMLSHTIVEKVESFAEFTLLQASLKTGRTHQIRVHLSHLGFPIVGDDKYGDFQHNRVMAKGGFKGMFLHAAHLSFPHPISHEQLTVVAPLPEALQVLLSQLRETATKREASKGSNA